MPDLSNLRVDVWSDVVCPWCYVGKRRLETALGLFGDRGSIDLVWHAFELDPGAPRIRDASVSYPERLAAKYGMPVDRARATIDRTAQAARDEGLDFRFDRAQSGNTFDAHRVLHLAHERGVQDAVKERLLRAYFTDGEPIGDPAALARLAGEAGLDADETARMLGTDAYAEAVRGDEAMARELGITGVPFFVVDGRYAVSGAQPAQALLDVLVRARDEANSRRTETNGANGANGDTGAHEPGEAGGSCDVASGARGASGASGTSGTSSGCA